MTPDFIVDNKKIIEKALESHFIKAEGDFGEICDAMQYSLMLGGKRIRPCLVLEFCKACGGDVSCAVDFACALEMIHTYSLVHDDLPCMDNDDFRRGNPSCHIKYGYANALLAGDALLTEAFKVVASAKVDDKIKVEAIKLLAENSGVNGMIGGQVMDLKYENSDISYETLREINKYKTGALLVCAAKLGCVAANRFDLIEPAVKYAQNIGEAFQIIDDVLDIVGDEAKLGKPIGSDEQNNKNTYARVNGVEKAKQEALRLTEIACEALNQFNDNANLIELAKFLLARDH